MTNTTASKSIKVMYTNADTLRNKMNELTERVKLLEPNIILINEVKPKGDNAMRPLEAEYKIDEKRYKIYSNNLDRTQGRGQIVHIDKSIASDQIQISNKIVKVIAYTTSRI